MRERLISVLNALMEVEVKGRSAIIIADCLRELQAIINEPPAKEDNECTE